MLSMHSNSFTIENSTVANTYVEGHHATDLVQIFNECFQDSFNTVLVAGGEEPIYLPRSEQFTHNRIIFTQDYFASALHEIAHWCVAGSERRKLVDFGYWYNPDGRTQLQQTEFERVEIKPQSLEWIFSQACGFKFRISADNLSAGIGASEVFRRNIVDQTQWYLSEGLPKRADIFSKALSGYYHQADFALVDRYSFETLLV